MHERIVEVYVWLHIHVTQSLVLCALFSHLPSGPLGFRDGPSAPVRLHSESRKCGELGADRPNFGGRKPREEGLAKKKEAYGARFLKNEVLRTGRTMTSPTPAAINGTFEGRVESDRCKFRSWQFDDLSVF